MSSLLPQVDRATLQALPLQPWNEHSAVNFADYLLRVRSEENTRRLVMLGNAVVPKCAEVAVSLLAARMAASPGAPPACLPARSAARRRKNQVSPACLWAAHGVRAGAARPRSIQRAQHITVAAFPPQLFQRPFLEGCHGHWEESRAARELLRTS